MAYLLLLASTALAQSTPFAGEWQYAEIPNAKLVVTPAHVYNDMVYGDVKVFVDGSIQSFGTFSAYSSQPEGPNTPWLGVLHESWITGPETGQQRSFNTTIQPDEQLMRCDGVLGTVGTIVFYRTNPQ